MGKLISAVLIVLNEERFLGDCLRSLAGVVDDIVVVDTGSSDRSRDVAVAHRARVFDYAWHDDFAAARNHALDHAIGDWILYIDADERLRPYDRSVLAQELADPRLCAATVRFYPRSGFTAYREHRLFRRDPAIRFRGAMHETILPDIERLIADDGRVRGHSELTIDHIGYDGDQSHKIERNLRLLINELQTRPNQTYLWWHLGTTYRELDQIADAEAAWLQGIEITRRIGASRPEDILCFAELAKSRLLKGEDTAALIAEARQLNPENLLVLWLEARFLIGAGRYAEAIPILERLGSIDPDRLVGDAAYDRRILGADAFAEAGYCAFQLGHYRESEAWYRRAERLAPDRLEFCIKRQLAGKRAGGIAGCYKLEPPS
jgi:glycosyltransferase involved in cell wall biosynthesis